MYVYPHICVYNAKRECVEDFQYFGSNSYALIPQPGIPSLANARDSSRGESVCFLHNVSLLPRERAGFKPLSELLLLIENFYVFYVHAFYFSPQLVFGEGMVGNVWNVGKTKCLRK